MPIILNGRKASVPDADKVKTIGDPKSGQLLFHPGFPKYTRARSFAPRAIVLHWTGSENVPVREADPKAHWSTVDTLVQRGYSYDFIIDSALKPGRRGIYQLADPVTTRTAHAGASNDTALGISCVSRGFATKADLRGSASDLVERNELDWETPRDVYQAKIAGQHAHLVSLHPDALHDTLWLVETLCGLLQIPRRIPWRAFKSQKAAEMATLEMGVAPVEHGGLWYAPLFDRDTRRWGRAQTFEGVYGHFHVHKDKWDPGTQLFEALWREGFNPAGVKMPRA